VSIIADLEAGRANRIRTRSLFVPGWTDSHGVAVTCEEAVLQVGVNNPSDVLVVRGSVFNRLHYDPNKHWHVHRSNYDNLARS
jgi:hypothetical protein